ncbi:MAG: threonine ammonia-lyase [Bacillota bacterium]
MENIFSVERVKKARSRMKDVIHLTPLDYSHTFSRLTGANLFLKLENMQKTGSFKIRGAYNKISALTAAEKSKGVIAASAGNHAQGVAYAASKSGIKATIVMPEGSPITKVVASRNYGAEVLLSGKDYDESFKKAKEIQAVTGATYIHGFDDPLVITGQGTIGLEILDQLPSVDVVVAPAGGGGLLGGISYVLKSIKPGIKIYGVQSVGAPAICHQKKTGEKYTLPAAGTLADGINVGCPGEITLDLIRRYVDDVVLVDDEEISQTILMLLERNKVVSEGAGAAALAAVLHGKIKVEGLNVVAIVSGGNIDVNILSTIIERGLVKSGRRLRIRTIISDRPGSLQKIVSLVASLQVNIISIMHDRSRLNVPIKQAVVEFVLETIDWDHVENVVESLKKSGYELEIL